MKIENFAADLRNISQAAIKVKVSSVQSSSTAPQSPKRDRADFDRRQFSCARTIKSAVKSELDVEINSVPAANPDDISAEIDRLKARASDVKEMSGTVSGISESAAGNKVHDMLKEQIKGISALLSDKFNGLSGSIRKQLEKIRVLLCEQEKNDSNSISKPLQKEMDKLSEMISSDKSEKSLSEMLEEQKNKLDGLFSHISNSDSTLSGIKNKIRQGHKLTATEQQYLSSKDPAAYESYQKVNTARTMFRYSLRSCRTRDDVIGMRLSNALSALASYKKAIREGGDGGDVVALNAAFENELRDYTRSSSFRSLPTVAECNKFDRDIAKARRYEREKRLEKQREQQRLRSKRYKKKVKKTPGDGKRTVAQVLADPTSKKVLASRAKRTYHECSVVSFSLYKTLNSKA